MRGLIAPAIVAAGFALAMSGCATPIEPLAWGFDSVAPGDVRLMLGVPNSDDLRVLALCHPHSGEIRMTIFGQRGDPPIVELHSGKLSSRHGGGGVQYDDESLVGVELQFNLRADDPVLMRVADTGELRMKLGDRWIHLPNGFAQEHDFLVACRTAN